MTICAASSTECGGGPALLLERYSGRLAHRDPLVLRGIPPRDQGVVQVESALRAFLEIQPAVDAERAVQGLQIVPQLLRSGPRSQLAQCVDDDRAGVPGDRRW